MSDDRAPTDLPASSAALAKFDPKDAVGPRTELDEEDARDLAEIAMQTSGPGPGLGCLSYMGAMALLPGVISPWSPIVSILMFGVAVASGLILVLRMYKRAIALRQVDLDPKLRRKAYRFAAGRVRAPRLLLKRRAERKELLAGQILERGERRLSPPSSRASAGRARGRTPG